MTSFSDERHWFGALKQSLRRDLTVSYGFSNQAAGEILNWFNPAGLEYLERVDGWQKWLCSACVADPTYAVPPFLRDFTRNAFGYYDITRIDAYSVGAIHQVAKMFYKWHGIPRRETNWDEVKDRLRRPLPMTLDEFEIKGIRTALARIRPIDLNSVIGRFGPGATYEGFDAYMKWRRKGLIPDVPPNLFRCSSRDSIEFQGFGPGITKIAEVPKSIKCNRIVSSEPAMYMYAQLAVNDDLVNQIHHLWPQHVSLDDQEQHNQALLWDKACSIDLSDASDHVSVELVQAVLPQLWPVLAKVRSTFSLFPDGDEIELSTFAPMGSGVCFSVMTTVMLGILEYCRETVEREAHARCWYHVYGDDIIVPVEMYDFTLTMLSRAGLVVNRAKSCCTQWYRESCGSEMFGIGDNAVCITPSYIRDPLDTVDAAKIEQIASSLDERLFCETASTIAELSESIRGTRWQGNLQRLEVCVRATSVRKKISSLDGWDGLNRWFSVHTQQNYSLRAEEPTSKWSGVVREVWTKPAWRYKSSQDYPYLTTWLVTRDRYSRHPRKKPRTKTVRTV